VKSLKLTHTV